MEQSLPGREERTLSADTEGARRATGVSAGAGAGVEAADPEVPAKARRRQFSPEYRLRILKDAGVDNGGRATGRRSLRLEPDRGHRHSPVKVQRASPRPVGVGERPQ